jgi:hypothetical protein
MASTCKRSLLEEVWTLLCLNKYLFRERIYKNIPEIDALNICVCVCVCVCVCEIENEDYELFVMKLSWCIYSQ